MTASNSPDLELLLIEVRLIELRAELDELVRLSTANRDGAWRQICGVVLAKVAALESRVDEITEDG